MPVANTLQTRENEIRASQSGAKTSRKETRFLRSLRSKGYVFFVLVLTYMVLATAFFFSQREKPLLQLAEYQKIQQTQAALVKADLAAFHVVTALFSQVSQAEFRQVATYFSSLKQQYQDLALLFPEQADTFARLEQSIPGISMEPDGLYLQKAQLHLAESKNEIERLIAANQARMTSLIRDYRHNDDLLVIKSLVLGTGGLVLIGVITTVFFNRLKSDLLRLQQRAAEIVKGYRGEPLPVTRQDEVGQLIEGVNYMSQALAEREQALEMQRRKASFREKMIAIDSLAGGIAHEMGNPITCIAGLVDEIANDGQNELSEQSQSMLEQLQHYSNGVVRITQDLSQLDTNNIDKSQWIDINQLLTKAVNLCNYDNRWSGIAIELDLDPGVPAMYASENQFNQFTMHILENARDALSGQNNSRVLLKTRFDPERGIRIIFEDNGAGVNADDLRHIFEPFFTTKAVGEGTGLGLAICWAIVESYNGQIRAESAPGGGLKIVTEFPLEKTSLDEAQAS
ncbi:MAG: ATP-binding protein [Gammaproteobacteria bacterium]|nr:ATP-binding protein [Gammaproteobacteria bacterium]